MGFIWDDVNEIADALVIAHADLDPTELSFPKLHALITELPDFEDDPAKSDEGKLEAIQMAWYDRIG